MKCSASASVFALGCLFLLGCRTPLVLSGHKAHATVLAAPSDGRASVLFYEGEVSKAKTVAESVAPRQTAAGVQHVARTGLIRVSVRARESQAAVEVCNRIAQAYIDLDDGVRRTLVEKAVLP